MSRQTLDAVHAELIDEHGGAHGVRDGGLIESALSRPLNRFAYAEGAVDLGTLAAAYAYGLVKNHGYVDGNKRVGLAAMLIFLRINGHRLRLTEVEAVTVIEEIASGDVTEEQLAWLIRGRMAPV